MYGLILFTVSMVTVATAVIAFSSWLFEPENKKKHFLCRGSTQNKIINYYVMAIISHRKKENQ